MLADIFFDGRIFLLGQINLFFLVEQNISAVVFHNLRLDIVARSILCGVHVGNHAENRLVLHALGCRDGSVDISHLIHKGIFNAQCLHLDYQCSAQNLLGWCGRNGVGCVVGLGTKADIM